MAEFKEIWVDWSDMQRFSNDKSEFKFPVNGANFLYQIYGDSPIYGRNTLLYIGKTIRPKNRTIEHLKTDFGRINNISISFGLVEESDVHILSIAESLLVTMLKPSYNSSNIKDSNILVKGNTKYIILNKGSRGVLPLEVTNIWW